MVTAVAQEVTRFVPRSRHEWRLRSKTLSLGERTLIMGIVNVTPDSFSDGGRFLDANAAVAHAHTLLKEGADILDIGGESTRPGSTVVSEQEELDRIMPVIERLRREAPSACLSVDTTKAEVAKRAVEAGAEIVNDVSGMMWDESMPGVCAKLGCGVILMHTRGRPDVWRHLPAIPPNAVLPLVRDDLRQRTNVARAAGIASERIALDPGFGFGKRGDENYHLLNGLPQLSSMGCPIAAGVSRKSFLGHTLADADRSFAGPLAVRRWQEVASDSAEQPASRGNVSVAAAVALALAGAHIVRVHDVRPAVEAVAIADAILRAAIV